MTIPSVCICRRAGKACFEYVKLPRVTQGTKEIYKPTVALLLHCSAALDMRKYTSRLEMKNYSLLQNAVCFLVLVWTNTFTACEAGRRVTVCFGFSSFSVSLTCVLTSFRHITLKVYCSFSTSADSPVRQWGAVQQQREDSAVTSPEAALPEVHLWWDPPLQNDKKVFNSFKLAIVLLDDSSELGVC